MKEKGNKRNVKVKDFEDPTDSCNHPECRRPLQWNGRAVIPESLIEAARAFALKRKFPRMSELLMIIKMSDEEEDKDICVEDWLAALQHFARCSSLKRDVLSSKAELRGKFAVELARALLELKQEHEELEQGRRYVVVPRQWGAQVPSNWGTYKTAAELNVVGRRAIPMMVLIVQLKREFSETITELIKKKRPKTTWLLPWSVRESTTLSENLMELKKWDDQFSQWEKFGAKVVLPSTTIPSTRECLAIQLRAKNMHTGGYENDEMMEALRVYAEVEPELVSLEADIGSEGAREDTKKRTGSKRFRMD
ncbi:unnamed protein product [Caenorhabditis bovis]|uniref:Uncharacterized protein n=1 Tax=Caenorhabditis bovis TaxID=2654633 RepID=A0A8S1FDC3_9PELO|nr:unnamed protein product [Caenorhabditis bovis]